MNWHDGLTLIWHLHSYGFKTWKTQIKFAFSFLIIDLALRHYFKRQKWGCGKVLQGWKYT